MINLEEHDYLCTLNTDLAKFYEGINRKAMQKSRHAYKGHLLPDPLAMAITLEPNLIAEANRRHIAIELQGNLTRGQTVVNYTRYATGKPNTNIIRKINMAGIIQIYKNMLTVI